MSGAEVVGFTLALLPLLISAAEHYDDCIRPILRYRKIVEEVHLFQRNLKVQRTIFRNQCRILLESVIEHDAAIRMLGVGSNDPSWGDVDLEEQLTEQLGASKEACATSIELINERLQSIGKESRDLQAVADPKQAVKHRLAKKIRFSISESRLDEYITSLRALNDDFTKLSNQTKQGAAYQTRLPKTQSRPYHKEISKYKAVGEASEKVYKALGKACTKHSEHLAHFCINPVSDLPETISTAQIHFRVAFTRLPLAGADGIPASDHDEPMWFMIDTVTSDSTVTRPVEDCDRGNRILIQTLKRELDSAAEHAPKKSLKSVRFQTPNALPTALPLTRLPTGSLLSTPRLRRDFCDVLKSCVGGTCQSYSCLGMLENSDDSKHRVYVPPTDIYYGSRHRTSLNELFSSKSRNGSIGIFTTYERLHLAKVLAIAVLQYHSTPWLNLFWRSADIFFFNLDEKATVQNTSNFSSLSSPHVNVKVKDSNRHEATFVNDPRQLSRTSASPIQSLAPNSLLFSLGIILLELAYSSDLRSLQQPGDLEDGRETRYTEFFIAKRLASTTIREMGSTYSKVVKKLLQCDFGCGDDLNDPKLQATFHRDIVCELEKLEQGFRSLQLS